MLVIFIYVSCKLTGNIAVCFVYCVIYRIFYFRSKLAWPYIKVKVKFSTSYSASHMRRTRGQKRLDN